MFDYVTVGHVTCDVVEQSGHDAVRRAGGTTFYSALQAARLGLRTLILTQGVPSEIEALLGPYLDELELLVIPAEQTTTMSTRGTGPERTQRVLGWAGPILDLLELDTAILHLAPVARETPVRWRGDVGFVGVTPQGLIRRWSEQEDVSIVQLDAGSLMGDVPLAPPDAGTPPGEIAQVGLDPALLPERFDAAVISEQERGCCGALFSAAGDHGAPVAVTAGSLPTTVYLPRGEALARTPPPPSVEMCDDIGAGDVFAAAFFVALAEGHTPLEAAVGGNTAATRRIEGSGPDAIGRRSELCR
jgi:sugar/nucleoside kinase (ribokinase family)